MEEGKNGVAVYERQWGSIPGHETANPESSFSVMTYNILNDSCIDEASYSFCDESIRYMSHRHKLIKEEVKHFDPTIVCMQEINIHQHDTLIKPMMADIGYGCVYSQRDLYHSKHGDAIFYKTDNFTLQRSKARTLYDVFLEEIKDKDLPDVILSALKKQMMLSHQVVLAQLNHISSGIEVNVASIHVFWGDLEFPDVQAAEVCLAIRSLQNFIKQLEGSCYIFAGDFNTPAGWPAYQMIEDTGKLNSESAYHLKQCKIKMDDGQITTIVETVPEVFDVTLKLRSSYKSVLGKEPPTTTCEFNFYLQEPVNYAFDYIWFSPETLDVTAVLKTPTDEAINREKALPNSLFPSDHLPMVAKFVINSK